VAPRLTLQQVQARIKRDCANLIGGRCRIHLADCDGRCCFFCKESLRCDDRICKYAQAAVLGPDMAGWERLFTTAALAAASPQMAALKRKRARLRRRLAAVEREIARLRATLRGR
jgi:hypothetical protein